MRHFLVLLVFTHITAILATTTPVHTVPLCQNLSIPISITSIVRQFPHNFNISQFNLTTAPELPSADMSGQYTIAASYCKPASEIRCVSDTLQILIHGSYYTRSYWSGLKSPPQSINGTEYSWIDFASSRGFATIAIDRLCNGLSSHPKRSAACQVENQVAILYALITGAREGWYGGQSFSRVILIGHSFGSLLIQAFTRIHPHAVDQIVLTGFSDIILQGNQAVARSGGFDTSTENQVDPAKWNSRDSHYIGFTNETRFVDSFYFGAFSRSLAKYNFQIAGTFNAFEAATSAFGQLPASNYTGSVIVVNGEHDGAVCDEDCGEGSTSLTEQVKSLYPNARTFSWHNTADTGHCLSLHFTAKESYQTIFNGLMRQAY